MEVGIIGLGDMGKLYAKHIATAGYRVNCCDLPSKYIQLKDELDGPTGNGQIHVYSTGFSVVRRSDFIIYSVEAAFIESCVALYGPATKIGSIVGGQTSVKEPEVAAFDKHLPSDVHIVTFHSLHGPNVSPIGQPLVVIPHRCTELHLQQTLTILGSLKSKIVVLNSYKEHDLITADTQAWFIPHLLPSSTHLAFLSMGSAWKSALDYPWENKSYLGGVDNVKILIALRIYSAKWHVYAGLAIMNPSAKKQINQYTRSVSDLFKLMIQENAVEFKCRILAAAEFVFGRGDKPILLSDDLLDAYSLSAIPRESRKSNSHLSLLAMVDSWHQCKINPYDHLICQTPPFRLILGITEYVFRDSELLHDSINCALYNKAIRADDMEFYSSVKGWNEVIAIGSMDGYRERFDDTAEFFKGRLQEASKISSDLIRTMAEKLV